LQAHIFPLFSVPPIVAFPEECRYEFGWLPSDLPTAAASMTTTTKTTTTTTTTTNQPLQQPQHRRGCLYVACPDGAFHRQESWDDGLRFAYFELKPFRRQGANWALIAKEETAMMAAILYQELRISKDRFVVLLFIHLSVIFLFIFLAFSYSVHNILATSLIYISLSYYKSFLFSFYIISFILEISCLYPPFGLVLVLIFLTTGNVNTLNRNQALASKKMLINTVL
jgi:hypothetical protein